MSRYDLHHFTLHNTSNTSANFKRVLGPRDQRIQRLFQKFYSKDESLEDIEINLLLQALVEQNKHQNFKEMS